jgi:hypothetical protein
MSADMENRCWRCGAGLAMDLLPLRREEVCPACDADLHGCKLCRFFNPSLSDACDEPIAGDVSNKERANFCDYFKPSPHAFRGTGSQVGDKERAALAALFGEAHDATSNNDADGARTALEGLFGIKKDT